MYSQTLERLSCPRGKPRKPRCSGTLKLGSPAQGDVHSGQLECTKCRSKFPILAGVAILVDDVRAYLVSHVKGIAQAVADEEIPREYRREFLEAKAEIQVEHIEEDLESKRVTALYVMNHYLKGADAALGTSPTLGGLIREHWDHGPLARIGEWITNSPPGSVLELGCGVGGLLPRIRSRAESYLGVDSSFGSIALARHLALAAPYRGPVRVPQDLLQGSVSRELKFPTAKAPNESADFVVGDIDALPIRPGSWDLTVALNAIDMLEDPTSLPKVQHAMLRAGGTAIQSCPYVWHETVAKRLRRELPREIQDSARAVAWLYEREGLKIDEAIEHLPWLFFKHIRQLEIYDVHLFRATRVSQRNA